MIKIIIFFNFNFIIIKIIIIKNYLSLKNAINLI